eukprot:scaffold80063_cov18-Tisochrysis_lutea.AAC.1
MERVASSPTAPGTHSVWPLAQRTPVTTVSGWCHWGVGAGCTQCALAVCCFVGLPLKNRTLGNTTGGQWPWGAGAGHAQYPLPFYLHVDDALGGLVLDTSLLFSLQLYARLPVDDDVGEMVLDTGTCAWGMQPVGPLTQAALGFEEDYSIMVTPAVLMPHTPSPEDSQDPGHQHKEHSSSSGSSSSSAGSSKERSSGCLTIPVQSRVRVPAGVHIAGWSWRPSDLDGGMEAGVQVVEGSVNNRQLEQGKDDVALVQVLANVQGYGYTATCLAKVPPDSAGDCSSEGGDNKGCSYEMWAAFWPVGHGCEDVG